MRKAILIELIAAIVLLLITLISLAPMVEQLQPYDSYEWSHAAGLEPPSVQWITECRTDWMKHDHH